MIEHDALDLQAAFPAAPCTACREARAAVAGAAAGRDSTLLVRLQRNLDAHLRTHQGDTRPI